MAKLDIQTLAVGEIQARLNDAREELMKLRFQQATGELTDFNRLRQTLSDDRTSDNGLE